VKDDSVPAKPTTYEYSKNRRSKQTMQEKPKSRMRMSVFELDED
jgi:hypothetical protein